MLDYGTTYTNHAKISGFLFSFLVSYVLRSSPLILSHLFNESTLMLYLFPFWIGIELFLISVFAVYGWTGVVLSILIDANLRPTLQIDPIVFLVSEAITVTIIAISHANRWYKGITPRWKSMLVAAIAPFPGVPVVSLIFLKLLEVQVTTTEIFHLALMWIDSLVFICITAPISLHIFLKRGGSRRNWAPIWLIHFIEGPIRPSRGVANPVEQAYSSRVERNSAQKYRIWWDFENVSMPPNEIRDFINKIQGEMIPGMVFADWNRFSDGMLKALYRAMVTPVHVPDDREDAADKVMKSKMAQVRHEGNITEVVVTGDQGFYGIVRDWVEAGVRVWIVTQNQCYSRSLAQVATLHSEISTFPRCSSIGEAGYQSSIEDNVRIICDACNHDNNIGNQVCERCNTRF